VIWRQGKDFAETSFFELKIQVYIIKLIGQTDSCESVDEMNGMIPAVQKLTKLLLVCNRFSFRFPILGLVCSFYTMIRLLHLLVLTWVASVVIHPLNVQAKDKTKDKRGEWSMSFRVSSTAFSHEGAIPTKYTCEGEDVSPPLSWKNIPEKTKSLALIVEDPDAPDPKAPERVWVHWVLFNIPPTVYELKENIKELPSGVTSGLNDWRRTGYGGPCPPIGKHRYFFRLYALDTSFTHLEHPSKNDLEEAMNGHILKKAELIGTYKKIRTK